jgi:hypothetical protein
MTNKFGQAIRQLGAASGNRAQLPSKRRSTVRLPWLDSTEATARNGTLAPADLRVVSSFHPGYRLAPLVSATLPVAVQRDLTSGFESEDAARAKAEMLGHIYSLTGAGS